MTFLGGSGGDDGDDSQASKRSRDDDKDEKDSKKEEEEIPAKFLKQTKDKDYNYRQTLPPKTQNVGTSQSEKKCDTSVRRSTRESKPVVPDATNELLRNLNIKIN